MVSDGEGGLSEPVTVTVVVSPANRPPIASLSVSPPGGLAPLVVTASATGSSDPDGTIIGYLWNDDAMPFDQSSQTFVYAEAGTYEITLRVVDDEGAISAPVTRSISVTAVSADDGVVDFVVTFDPILDAGGSWSQPSDAVLELREDPTSTTPVVVDIDALLPFTTCPPQDAQLTFVCEATAAVPVNPGNGYRVTYPALGDQWLLTYANDCARPLDANRYGWFNVTPSSTQTCELTATEFTEPVDQNSAAVTLRQTWVTGDGFTDGQAEVILDGEPVEFPNEDCGRLGPDDGIRDDDCDLTVAVQPASSTLIIEPATGWTVTLAGDCIGPASAATFTLAPTNAGTCDITYTWGGGSGADDGVVDFVVTFDPILDAGGSWSQPSDAVLELREDPTSTTPVVVDIDALLPFTTCPPQDAQLTFVCEATAAVPVNPGNGYRVTYPALGDQWLLTYANDCARPLDANRYGWFNVTPSSTQTCELTATEFTEPVDQNSAAVTLRQTWVTGDGFTDGQAEVILDGEPVEFPNEDCGRLGPDDGIRDDDCDLTVAVQPASSTLIIEPATGWTVTLAGDCIGPASAATFTLAPTNAGTCDITYTWGGGSGADDGVVDFVVTFDPILDAGGSWSQPSDAVLELREDPTSTTPVVVDIDALLPFTTCPPQDAQLTFVCEATAAVPVNPGNGYRVTYPALGDQWLLTYANDCARPLDANRYGWFNVTPSSTQTCELTATEFTEPVDQDASVVEFEYRWIVDGVPRARSVFAPSVAVGADDISDEFEYCEDLSSVAQSGCTVTVPTSVGSIFVEEPSSGTWVFSFGADCAGGSDGPVPPDRIAAQIVDFTANTAYRCTIDATEIPDPFPAPDANLTADPTRGDAPLTVTLDASGSTPAEFIANYEFLLVAEVLADDGSLVEADTITIDRADPVLVTVLPDLGTPTLWRARVRVTDDLVRRNTSAAVDIRVGLNAAPRLRNRRCHRRRGFAAGASRGVGHRSRRRPDQLCVGPRRRWGTRQHRADRDLRRHRERIQHRGRGRGL